MTGNRLDTLSPSLEWLQTNRRGSFAMGSADRLPRRKYHSLLTVREPGHGDPLNLLAEIGEAVAWQGGTCLLHGVDYGDAVHPDGRGRLTDFSHAPLPRWTYGFGGLSLARTLELDPEEDRVRVAYRLKGSRGPATLTLSPFVLCRPLHALTQQNPFLNGALREEASGVSLQPYPGSPRIHLAVSGARASFVPDGHWLKGVFYAVERDRGYGDREDWYCPGSFRIALPGDAAVSLEAATLPPRAGPPPRSPRSPARSLRGTLRRAVLQFPFARRDGRHSVIAGYPWFGEWGRDSLIALPGICRAAGNDAGLRILEGLTAGLQDGLVPNVLATPGHEADLNAADASLLFIRAVQWLEAAEGPKAVASLMPAVFAVLEALRAGALGRIRVTPGCGLLVAPGPRPLTWMDAIVDGQAVTPRHGYAVDLNALLYNAARYALEAAARRGEPAFARAWAPLMEGAEAAFMARFWLEAEGWLADAHDGERADASLRPNQLWALALPHSPVPAAAARRALAAIRARLLTPAGLRTLSPDDPRYRGRYAGSQRERDLAYHQGTVWPWLLGIYADAVLRFEGRTRLREDLAPVLERLSAHLDAEGCLGQVSEVFDGDAPHAPGGAPAQAWSAAEALRAAGMIA